MGTQRALAAALRRLLQDGFDGDQTAMRQRLVAVGCDVSQSSISRALQRLGAHRSSGRGGSVRYELAPNKPVLSEAKGGGIADLVLSLASNTSLVVVRTRPGCASAVAACIDGFSAPEILGSIAGDDTVLVVPRSVSQMEETLARLALVLGHNSGGVQGRRRGSRSR